MSLYTDFISTVDVSRNGSDALYCDSFDVLTFKKLLIEPITIMSDYDCDGLNAGLVAYGMLKRLGYNVHLYYNDPSIYANQKYAYGLNKANVFDMLSKYPETKTIITADEGIGADLSFLQGRYNVIITDHHVGESSDSVSVTFDPMVLDNFKFKGICGATVIYQLIYQLAIHLGVSDDVLFDISCFEVFAGIATIGDSMPLTDFNVGLVRRSIKRLIGIMNGFVYSDDLLVNNAYTALFNIISMFDDKIHIDSGYMPYFLTAEFISFYYVPLINTIKRLNKPCKLFYDVFLNAQPVDMFFQFNEERKQFVEEVLSSIDIAPDVLNKPPFLYFINEDKYSVAGLIANKLMEATGYPTIVLDKNTLHGSGRSFSYFPLLSLLKDNGFQAGGHEPAFGIGFKSMSDADRLYSLLSTSFVKQMDLSYFKRLSLTSESVVLDLIDFYMNLNNHEPFGVGFKMPLVALDICFSQFAMRVLKDKHIKLSYPNTDNPLIDIMIFNYHDYSCFQNILDITQCGDFRCTVVGSLSPNYFNGRFTFTFLCNDLF